MHKKLIILIVMITGFVSGQEKEDYYNKGLSEFKNKDFKNAETSLTESIKNGDNVALSYLLRGQIKGRLKRHNEAIIDFTASIKLDSTVTTATYIRYIRGISYIQTKEYDKAIIDFDNVIYEYHNYKEVYFWRGKAKSLILADISAFLPPENIKITKENNGSQNKELLINSAIKDFDNAIINNPNDGNSYMHRGLLYGVLNQFDKACADLTKAVSLHADISPEMLETTCLQKK